MARLVDSAIGRAAVALGLAAALAGLGVILVGLATGRARLVRAGVPYIRLTTASGTVDR